MLSLASSDSNFLFQKEMKSPIVQWRSHGGTGGTSPPTYFMGWFLDSPKSDEKSFGGASDLPATKNIVIQYFLPKKPIN